MSRDYDIKGQLHVQHRSKIDLTRFDIDLNVSSRLPTQCLSSADTGRSGLLGNPGLDSESEDGVWFKGREAQATYSFVMLCVDTH